MIGSPFRSDQEYIVRIVCVCALELPINAKSVAVAEEIGRVILDPEQTLFESGR